MERVPLLHHGGEKVLQMAHPMMSMNGNLSWAIPNRRNYRVSMAEEYMVQMATNNEESHIPKPWLSSKSSSRIKHDPCSLDIVDSNHCNHAMLIR